MERHAPRGRHPRIGGDPERIMEARREKGSWHGYLELHIEQGGTLERATTAIGVVQGIVAIERYEASITGFANHAGTTPMAERQDAMIAASHLTLAVREIVTKRPGARSAPSGRSRSLRTRRTSFPAPRR